MILYDVRIVRLNPEDGSQKVLSVRDNIFARDHAGAVLAATVNNEELKGVPPEQLEILVRPFQR